MGRPKDITPYASSIVNYPAGSDPWAGTLIRVVPPTDYRIPRTPEPAEYLNHTMGTVSDAASGMVKFSGQTPADNWVTNAVSPAADFTKAVGSRATWDPVCGRWIFQSDNGTSHYWQTLDGGKTFLALGTTNQPAASSVALAVHPTSGLLVAIASDANATAGLAGAGATYATGVTTSWTTRSSCPSGGGKTLTYFAAAGLFVGMGTCSTTPFPFSIATSPDGVTWTDRSSGTSISNGFGGTTSPKEVPSCQSPTTLLLFSPVTSATTYYSSTNGTTYTSHTSPVVTGEHVVAASYDNVNGVFVILVTPASGSGTSRVLTSPDGVTWTANNLPASLSQRCAGMSALGSLYFVVGFSAGVAGGTYRRGVYSTDMGVTWRWSQNFVLATPTNPDNEKVFTNGSVFVATNDLSVSVSSASGLSDVAV